MNYIIGIDIGTTNSKAVAYSYSGQVLVQSNCTYPHLSPAEGYHELDPLALFNAVCTVIKTVVQHCNDHQLSAVCFSSAMHGVFAVDHQGDPLTNMITWADLRSSAYAKKLKADSLAGTLYERTGTPIHAMAPLCKLMWMKDNLPEIFAKAYKFISIKEFVFFRFFNRFIIDRSVASSTGLFDIHSLTWNQDALRFASISEERLSEHVATTAVISGLVPRYSKELGIGPDIPFVIGGSDGCMAHIGSNALEPGDVSITIGTSGAVRIMNDAPVKDPNRSIFNYLITDSLYLSGGPVNNGGNVMQWFARNFLKKDFRSAEEIDRFIAEALLVPPGSDDLVFLPYIFGERAPVWDADARGIFFGVSASHTLSHFMRAAMEGISFSLFSILHAVEEVNGPANRIFASGGFIRSREWVSLLADVIGKPLRVTHGEDSSAAGAVILGMQSLGIIHSWHDAASFFGEAEVFEPDMKAHEVYMRNFGVYSNLYNKFRDLKS